MFATNYGPTYNERFNAPLSPRKGQEACAHKPAILGYLKNWILIPEFQALLRDANIPEDRRTQLYQDHHQLLSTTAIRRAREIAGVSPGGPRGIPQDSQRTAKLTIHGGNGSAQLLGMMTYSFRNRYSEEMAHQNL